MSGTCRHGRSLMGTCGACDMEDNDKVLREVHNLLKIALGRLESANYAYFLQDRLRELLDMPKAEIEKYD